MKLYIFILCVCVSVHVTNSHNHNHNRNHNHENYCRQKCPLFDPPSGTVHLPGPVKNHFYKCDHGIGIMFVCPGKTQFNPRNQICDWPNRANAVTCKDSPNHIFEGSGDGRWHE